MIVGDGGREDAFARYALDSDPNVRIIADVGLAGVAHNYPGRVDRFEYGLDSAEVARIALTEDPQLVFVGPEAPLVAGMGDLLREVDVPALGVNSAGAKFEASKDYSATFNKKYGIPQPESYSFTSLKNAKNFFGYNKPLKWVIKADGLAGGKGVVLPSNQEEANETLEAFMRDEMHGSAGEKVVLQERISGPEVSVMVLVSNGTFTILPPSQDHKRLMDGDRGANTGGMGAYTGVPESILNANQWQAIEQIAEKFVEGTQAEGIDYDGIVYFGLILDENEPIDETGAGTPKMLEYNVRLGDPETQVILPSIPDSLDFMDQVMRVARGQKLKTPTGYDPRKISKVALTVCLAGEGYPTNKYEGSRHIAGATARYPGVVVNHANTWLDASGRAHSKGGGRMLYVTGSGQDVESAATAAYSAIGPEGINSRGMQYRTDIGWQVRGR